MNIRPVKTEQDYDASMSRIEALWGAEAGTPEGDELDVLLTLAQVYAEEHHPVPPPSPIEAIKFVMDQRGLKQADLVPFIGSRSKVSEVLSGKRPLTLAMIRALKSSLRIPAEVLIQEDTFFPEDGEEIEWQRFPAKEIVKRGLVTGFDPKTQHEEIVRELVTLSGVTDFYESAACLRQGTRRSQKDDHYAVQAWLLQVLVEAKSVDVANRFDPQELDEGFLKRVARLSVFPDGPLKAKEYLALNGIKLVVAPHFKRTYLDGAVLFADKHTPVIGMTLRYDRLDNFWFTLLHELAHLINGHVQYADGNCIIDDLDLSTSLDAIEQEADMAANEALIPSELWENHPVRETARLADVRALARQADVNPAVVAGRVRYANNNYRILARQVGHGEVKQLFTN